jgi:hypothetical protein
MGAPEFSDKALQNRQRPFVVATKSLLLDSPGQHPQQQIPPQPVRGLAAEFRSPGRTKLRNWKAGKARDFSGYGFG